MSNTAWGLVAFLVAAAFASLAITRARLAKLVDLLAEEVGQ